MGRIRTIKPEFFKHSELFDAERDTKLPLRLAFAGLWTCCDREGRFKWRPRELKLDILPFDNCDFSRVLDALATRGFIVQYASGNDAFGHIPTWNKHQVINNRESSSTIPEPPLNQILDACGTRDSPVDDARGTPLVGKGKEGKGREGKESAFALPDWVPPAIWMAFEIHRKSKRSPMTDHAKHLIIQKLDKLRHQGHDPTDVLNESIRRGWVDVFEIKGGNNGQRTFFSQSRTAGNFDAAREALAIMASQNLDSLGDSEAGECIEGHVSDLCQ